MRLLLLFLCIGVFVSNIVAAPASLDALLDEVRAKTGLPGLAAAVVRSNSIVAVGAVGLRKFDATNQITLADKFHVGSCTKPMTATLVAMLVEQGHMGWSTNIKTCFPDWTDVHSNYSRVTIEQLLSHRAGIPGDLRKSGIWRHVWERSKLPPMEQRVELAREVLARPPENRPGTMFLYANAGYTVVGVMIERREQKAWEDLLRERLFEPLGMKSAGFGVPASPGQIDQPWGHVLRDGKLVPIAPGPSADNPAAIGPGGTVHCSIGDLAEFARLHLEGAKGNARLLKRESFRRLHTARVGDYALGWGTGHRPWAKGRTLNHMGSNTMNTAIIWIAPEIDFAMVIACNQGGKEAELACDGAATRLIQELLK
jgi:CubicO group peptidase (beta-lactamase class C family)